MDKCNFDCLDQLDSKDLCDLIAASSNILERRFDSGTLRSAQINDQAVLSKLETSFSVLARIGDRMYARLNKEETHVNYFIDYGTPDDRENNKNSYARWMLMHFTLSATLRNLFKPIMSDYKLFCTYEGRRHRVTGASRLGDIWLSETLVGEPKHTYDHRVCVSKCTAFDSKA